MLKTSPDRSNSAFLRDDFLIDEVTHAVGYRLYMTWNGEIHRQYSLSSWACNAREYTIGLGGLSVFLVAPAQRRARNLRAS